MSLLRDIIKSASIKQMVDESAAGGATSAGAVAGFRAPLLGKKKMRRAVPTMKVSEEQEETASDYFARLKRESMARRAAKAERDDYDSSSSGRLSSRFGSARRAVKPTAPRQFSSEQEETNAEYFARLKDESMARRAKRAERQEKDYDSRSSGRLSSRFSSRPTPSTSGALFSMEQEENKEQVDWNKEVEKFRERSKSAPPSRKRRLRSSRRMDGPSAGVFSMRFEAIGKEGSVMQEALDDKFDPADVISKLRAAEEKSENEDNTRGFALEDEDGNIVKVYVSNDQAEEFEQALGAALSGEDDDDDEENTSLEIAEVLFNLKDRFTIVDVEWPEVEEDEEDMATDAGDVGDNAEEDLDDDLEGAGEGGDLDLDVDEGDDLDVDLNADVTADADAGAGGDESSTLASMIDLLKSQAEAQKAEAQAREAEANAEEAKYNAQAAESKVKQEEEVLDMEAYYDKKSSADKEAKKLQKLAKWKHEVAQEGVTVADEEQQEVYGAMDGDEIPGNKFEEPGADENQNHRMEPGEFIKYMLMNARRNP